MISIWPKIVKKIHENATLNRKAMSQLEVRGKTGIPVFTGF